VFHLADGIVDEAVEYCDTLHVSETLDAPPRRAV